MSTNQETIRLGIDGMTCAGCVSKVEKALVRVQGVRNVRVSLAAREARIFYDGASGSVTADFEEAIRAAGFEPRAISAKAEEIEQAERREDRAMKSRLVIAAIFTIPIVLLEMGY